MTSVVNVGIGPEAAQAAEGTGRRGRPSKPYRTTWGEEIHGLYKRPDGRWRVVETGKLFTEADERRAVQKFRDWQAAGTPSVSFDVGAAATPEALTEDGAPDLGASITSTVGPDGKVQFQTKVNPTKLWAYFRDVLLNDPNYAAKMTGLPELAGWRHMAIPKAGLALAALWESYQTHNGAKQATKDQTELVWNRFTRGTAATTLDGLTHEALLAYRRDIEGTIPSPNTRKFHYSKVRTVLAFGLKTGMDPVQIREALDKAKVLWTAQRAAAPKPTPISRDDFHALLTFTETHPWEVWRPWLLVGLNFAMHIGEVCELRWEEIDLDKGTYASIRAKTAAHRIPRAATLWPETLEALTALRQARRQSEYVFTSHYGTRYNRNKRVNTFGEFRTAAGLPEITFDSLRDGAYTAACQGTSDERWARVLAGHRSPGLQDNYVLRNPEIVRPACEAVYKAYGPFPAPAAPKAAERLSSNVVTKLIRQK